MGYMRHHTIVVTSWNANALKVAREMAIRLKPLTPEGHKPFSGLVSEILSGVTNGYGSFFIAPDGSKEGWEPSDLGNSWRDQFVSWLRTQTYEDGSSCLDWVEVQFGDDDKETKIVRDSDRSEQRQTKIVTTTEKTYLRVRFDR